MREENENMLSFYEWKKNDYNTDEEEEKKESEEETQTETGNIETEQELDK